MNASITTNDLSWAAGFVDGEGCVTIARQTYPNRRNPTYRPQLSIAQNDKETLLHLRAVIGIPVSIHPSKRAPNHRRQVWVLQYFGRKAIEAMSLLAPYLVRKGPEVAVCMELWENTDLHRYPGRGGFPPETWELRRTLWQKIRALK